MAVYITLYYINNSTARLQMGVCDVNIPTVQQSDKVLHRA